MNIPHFFIQLISYVRRNLNLNLFTVGLSSTRSWHTGVVSMAFFSKTCLAMTPPKLHMLHIHHEGLAQHHSHRGQAASSPVCSNGQCSFREQQPIHTGLGRAPRENLCVQGGANCMNFSAVDEQPLFCMCTSFSVRCTTPMKTLMPSTLVRWDT